MDEMDFGVCNVNCHRTLTLYLSNITEVSAKWSLNYVKFPKKTTISKYTETQWEAENLKKVDDPDVFEFSISGVSVSFYLGRAQGQVAASPQHPRRPLRSSRSHGRGRAPIPSSEAARELQAKAERNLQV
jgi:hypothetical protein